MKKIFLLHGWTYTTEKWNELARQLSLRGFELVLLPIPGLTETTDKVWQLDDYVDWLKTKLDRELHPIVIGHSNGGRIALAYAAKYPAALSHLILICSAGIYHNELPIRIKRRVFGMAAKLGKKLTSSATLRNLLYRLAREHDYKNATPQIRATMHNLISVDLTSRLQFITTPTLIIWGENDTITPLVDGQIMHKSIKNSKLSIVKNAGHSPHFTNVQEVTAHIVKEIRI